MDIERRSKIFGRPFLHYQYAKGALPRLGTLSFLLAAAICAVSIIYLVECFNLSIGTVSAPEEGFVPLIFGILLCGSSSLLMVGAFMQVEKGAAPIPKANKAEIFKFFMLIAVLIGYVVLLPMLGFTFSTFGLIAASAKIMQAKWGEALILAAGVTLINYLLFIFWMGIPLPSF